MHEQCPNESYRGKRILAIALVYVAVYIIILYQEGSASLQGPGPQQNHSTQQTATASFRDRKIQIFYNLFTKSAEDGERVRKLVDEQLGLIDPKLHETNISITSIGYRLDKLPAKSFQHHDEGGEELTLKSLWQYCKSNSDPSVRVVYLHSKGSYHPSEANNKLRNFVTQGALSAECANLPEECNVCSSRMSPLPHPHTSGNMWLARCDYIARLIDPMAMSDGKLPEKLAEDNPCAGRGRYLGEHWVHSHPSVKPCDLYPGKEFTWAHLRVPPGVLKKDLRSAPRFKFQDYVLPGMCKDQHPETLALPDFVDLRIQNYDLLYNISTLGEEWWGWQFLRDSLEG